MAGAAGAITNPSGVVGRCPHAGLPAATPGSVTRLSVSLTETADVPRARDGTDARVTLSAGRSDYGVGFGRRAFWGSACSRFDDDGHVRDDASRPATPPANTSPSAELKATFASSGSSARCVEGQCSAAADRVVIALEACPHTPSPRRRTARLELRNVKVPDAAKRAMVSRSYKARSTRRHVSDAARIRHHRVDRPRSAGNVTVEGRPR